MSSNRFGILIAFISGFTNLCVICNGIMLANAAVARVSLHRERFLLFLLA